MIPAGRAASFPIVPSVDPFPAELVAQFPLLQTPLREVVAFVFGLVFGSFANVVILRWPAGQSIVKPGSRCRGCGQPLAWYDNLPVLSFLILRGRCRQCGAAFSGRAG
jgi:leader peptidase (prepilin peptidase)/N-methyltransferase